MKIFFMLFFASILSAAYMSNESCKECHDKIYEEFQGSQHSKGYFNDELHRKVADLVSTQKYECATCHMPAADNLKELLEGTARPDKNNVTHTDAISCFFCHQIAYVKKAHQFNINTIAIQAQNYKPSLYGRLDNVDETDKHSSINNPVYIKNVCKGCHSHKVNDHNVTIFQAMEQSQDSIGCVDCHMPTLNTAGAEKMDKRARGKHVSHQFLGIRDAGMREKSVDINISTAHQKIEITLTNKMEHPLISQPARVKFVELSIMRGSIEIWKNFKVNPSEDKQLFFEFSFKDETGKQVIIPAGAKGHLRINNLGAKETKTFSYETPELKSGDIVKAAMYVKLAKKDCEKATALENPELTQTYLMKSVEKVVGVR